MPRGRVRIRGDSALGRLSWKVGIGSLKGYRGVKAADRSCREARNAHKKIRDAVNFYRLAHGGLKGVRPETRTNIVKAVTKVKKNASCVVRTGGQEEKWLDRLSDALSVRVNRVNLLAGLHFAMRRQNIDIFKLRSRIDRGTFSLDDDLPAVKALAKIDVKTVVPPAGHPDPPLVDLVTELMPVWQCVTGTSPYPKNDRYGHKVCPFSKWVTDLIIAAGLHPPPENTVARLVRLQKMKNRVPKIIIGYVPCARKKNPARHNKILTSVTPLGLIPMVSMANLVVTAWDGRQLIGIARSITDFCYVAYLSDIAVAKARQHQGIGTKLIEHTRQQLGPNATIILLAAPAAEEYYPKIGMHPHPSAWILTQDMDLRS